MQTDNNLVLYDSNRQALWSTNTWSLNYKGSYFGLESSGNAYIYDDQGIMRWRLQNTTNNNTGSLLDLNFTQLDFKC